MLNTGRMSVMSDQTVAPKGAADAASTVPAMKYYSKPADLDIEIESAATAMKEKEQAAKKAQYDAEQAAKDLKEKQDKLKLISGKMRTTRGQELLGQLRSEIQQGRTNVTSRVKRAQAAAAEYEPAAQKYRRSVGKYNKWRSTIRDAETVRAELTDLDSRIKTLERLTRGRSDDLGQSMRNSLEQLRSSRDLIQEELDWAEHFYYADMAGNDDYKALSRYNTTANGRAAAQALGGMYAETGFDNVIYDYINRNQDAAKVQRQQNLIQDYSHLEQMTDDEIGIYNYLYAKEGAQSASKYLDHLKGKLTSRQREKLEETMAKQSRESPVLASALSLAAAPVKGVAALGQVVDYLADGEINENAGYNRVSHMSSAIRGEVSNLVESKWGKVGSAAYQLGMSMADSLANGVAGRLLGSGTAAKLIIGSGVAADVTIESKDRGLSSGQAFKLGTVAGVAEALMESIGIDELLHMKATGKGRLWKSMVSEGLEELGTDVINSAFDAIISKDESQWNQSIQGYMANGESREKAEKLTLRDTLMQWGGDFLGGAVSGGVFGGIDLLTGRGNKAPDADARSEQTAPQVVKTAPETEQMVQNPERTPGFAEQAPAEENRTPAMPKAASFSGENSLQQIKEQTVAEMSPRLKTLEEQSYLRRLEAAKTDLEISGVLTGAEDEKIQTAQRLANLLGKRILFEPADQAKNGWYVRSEDTIYLNPKSNNPVAQVIGHELTHSIEVSGEDYGKLQRLVTERIGKAGGDMSAMRKQKIDLYAQNNVSISEAQADREIVAEYVEKHLLTDEQAIREMVQDDRGLARRILDWLDGLLLKFTKRSQERQFVLQARDAYRRALQESYKIHDADRLQQAKMRAYAEGDDAAGDAIAEEQWATEGYADRLLDDRDVADVEFSIGKTKENRPFVAVEQDILDGVPQENWIHVVKENLKRKFPEGITLGRNTIEIDRQSRNEMTRSRKTVRMRKRDPQAYADKFRATDNAGEILRASTGWINEEANHQRTDAIQDFARGNVLLRVGANDYSADVIVATKMDGTMILYDIVNMKKASITEKSQVQGNTGIAQNGHHGRLAPDNNSIYQDGGEVNRGTAGESDNNQVQVNTANAQNGLRSSLVPDASIVRQNGSGVNKQFSISEDAVDEQADPVATLPWKAQSNLKTVERKLVNGVANSLNVPFHGKREFLQPIVREISQEFLRSGIVSQETADRLFDEAYKQGIVVDTEFYDTYKHVKEFLRLNPVAISEQDQGDIADFGDFRKRAMGTLRISRDGTPVDSMWRELQEMAPDLFPNHITHPADQLVHMLDVGQNIKRAEYTLERYYGRDAENFKALARGQFDAAVGEAVAELRKVKRYDEDAKASREEQDHMDLTQEEVTALYPKLKETRRNYEKAMAKNLLTQEDQKQVSRLLRGDIGLEHLKPERDNVEGITAVYEAKLEYEKYAQQIRQWNRSRKAKLMAEAAQFTESANSWKDKAKGILYSRETMERNIRDIVPNKELAERIIDTYFKPVHDAAAQANRTKNKYRDRIRALNISRKAEGDHVSEAYAVQLLGEAEDNIRVMRESRGRIKTRDGKTIDEWQAVINEMWQENPQLDQAKIRKAVEEFRKIYNELFEQMNEARVRNGYEPVNYRQGYFPHFQAKDEEGVMALFGKALGIKTEVTALPTSINGLTHTFKPGIRWMGNALERKGFETVYDALEGFDRYIEGVADVIHQTDNIQRLRALAAQVRYNSTDEGIKQKVDKIRARDDLSEIDKETLIKEEYEKARFALSNFVVELDEYTNLLANKKSRADRNMEQAMGRDMYNLVKAWESRVAANMVAVNPGSWITNFIPLTQGAATLDKGLIWKGMWDTLRAIKDDDGFVDSSSFLINRRGSDPLVQTWQQQASATLSKPMEWIDSFTADSLVRARFQQNVNRGMSDDAAIAEADQWAAGVMADRSKGATPTLFNRNNPLTKLFTQFQLEVNNQLSYVAKDIPREAGQRDKYLAALAVMLFKFAIGAFLYNEGYEYMIGRRPALDPLGILNDTVGDITGFELPNMVEFITGEDRSLQTEKLPGHKAVGNLAANVMEEIPFVGGLMGGGRLPISSALPDWENLSKAAFNDEWSPEKRIATAAKELGNPLTYLALPFGGGQAKKILQGVKAVIDGGSYTMDNQGNDILQYPIYADESMNALRAVIFGKTTTTTGVDWVNSGFKNLSAKATAAYQNMLEADVPNRDAYELVKALADAKKTGDKSADDIRRSLLRASKVSDEGKAIAYYALLASEKEQALMDELDGSGENMGTIVSTLMDIRESDAKSGKLDVLMESGLSQESMEKFAGHVMGTELTSDKGKPTQYADYLASVEAGLEPAKALQMQQDGIDLGKIVELTEAGLNTNLAVDLIQQIHELEPVNGKDQVSGVQKWRVACNVTSDPEEQMAALEAVMEASAYKKLAIGYDYGVEPGAYVRLREILPEFDSNGSGSYSNDEIKAAIDSMSASGLVLPGGDGTIFFLTVAQKAALWQLWSTGSSAKNNPYDPDTGWAVLEAKKAE